MENFKQSKINSKVQSESEFSFSKALDEVISDLPQRSREIVKSRFGIGESEPKTLEEVGKTYKITRERVRQIIKEALKKIKQKSQKAVLAKIGEKIEFTIAENSGIISEKDIFEKLSGGNAKEKNAIRFFLDCLENIREQEEKSVLDKSFILADFNLADWKKTVSDVKDILEKEKRVFTENELFEKFSRVARNLNYEKLFHFLSVSSEIKANTFENWGLARWKEINPRVTMQKAYLILKETKQPLHFREIAALIDKHGLGKRKTHPQTVHNELIKNEAFVLVGRGTYALAEWGFKEGTVKEVLEDILKQSGKPMKRNDILDKVLKMRQVKKSTILINLNNFFEKAGKDAYTAKSA